MPAKSVKKWIKTRNLLIIDGLYFQLSKAPAVGPVGSAGSGWNAGPQHEFFPDQTSSGGSGIAPVPHKQEPSPHG